MCLNYKRAIFTAVVFYAVIFLIISAMMFTPLWGTSTLEYVNLAIGFVLAYLLASMFYFKARPKNYLKEGLCLGLVIAAVSFVIEIPVMVYGFAAAQGWAWFGHWNLWVGYVLGMVACIIAAKMKK